jgi:hypothetical protein
VFNCEEKALVSDDWFAPVCDATIGACVLVDVDSVVKLRIEMGRLKRVASTGRGAATTRSALAVLANIFAQVMVIAEDSNSVSLNCCRR